MVISKSGFVQQLIDKHKYTKAAATMLVDDFWDVMYDNIEAGNTVLFQKYGKFELIEHKGSRIRLPNSDEYTVIPSHLFVRFYPGASLKLAARTYESNKNRGLT